MVAQTSARSGTKNVAHCLTVGRVSAVQRPAGPAYEPAVEQQKIGVLSESPDDEEFRGDESLNP
jgi:hypothetical protein